MAAAKFSELKAKLDATEAECEDLLNQKKELENTVRELESVHQSYPGKVKYLQESLDRNEEGRDILLEKIHYLENQISNNPDNVYDPDAEEEEKELLQEELKDKKNERTRLEFEIENHNRVCTHLKNEILDYKEKLRLLQSKDRDGADVTAKLEQALLENEVILENISKEEELISEAKALYEAKELEKKELLASLE
ncbi:centrosomal protein of 290 kDa-like [Zophobas morio]|uniref:centrosomal protein of 290 kDa-like n=1 Tax=Zophobas morio TaxID=2755281 RepID=UPI0030836C91